ncbi:MAG: NAD-dependent DNA ligase LigA [Tissierellia bacterium]|nr:NAD-dependent DNA ligase LigA [Tissierellia bacterium]
MDKKQEIDNLIKKIEKLNYNYYTLDEPLVSDGEYDKIYQKLRDLENETGYINPMSPTQRVGGQILDKFEKHYHISRLYSLDKSQSYDDIKSWIDRCERLRVSYNKIHDDKLPELEFLMEYKFDGLTINLHYNNGKLISAASRGNGIVGEDITAQVLTINSISTNIKEKSEMEIQGEGLMPLSSLKAYNEKYDTPLKNARNAASGALRNLNTAETKKRNLTAFFYSMPTNNLDFKTEEEMLEFLKDQNINVYPYKKLVKNFDDIIEELKRIEEERRNIDILTDGVVIKINDIKTQKALGYTNKFPRWAIAFKYDPDEYTTILKDVKWNVGRSGKVTPSAILEPVDFNGVTVKRATLNNYDDIKRKKVKIGSKVFIRRSNDVIPEILGVVDENQEGTKKIEKPKKCPYCGSDLIETNVHIYCPNSISCTPQLVARIEHFASRNAMDIEGFSEKTIIKLMSELNVKEIYDIYDLKFEDLIELEGFKDKKSNNLIQSIEKSKKVDLNSFIYAIGIPNVGQKTANDLAIKFKSFENLRNAKKEQLVEIEDIGDIVAQNIVDFFNDENIKDSIDKLLSKGIKIKENNVEIQSDLEGQKYVITGIIDNYKRDDIKNMLIKKGAKVATSVSKNTDYLLSGEKPGSKRDKAAQLGIKILENEELYEFIKKLQE